MQIDRVYRKSDAANTDYSADIAGGSRCLPISLPRVRWLEKDPDCPYDLVENLKKAVEQPKPELPNGVRFKNSYRRSRGSRKPAPRWTPEEDAIALQMRAKKIPEEEIAIKCGRSRKAVMQRLRLIDLSNRDKEKANNKRSV